MKKTNAFIDRNGKKVTLATQSIIDTIAKYQTNNTFILVNGITDRQNHKKGFEEAFRNRTTDTRYFSAFVNPCKDPIIWIYENLSTITKTIVFSLNKLGIPTKTGNYIFPFFDATQKMINSGFQESAFYDLQQEISFTIAQQIGTCETIENNQKTRIQYPFDIPLTLVKTGYNDFTYEMHESLVKAIHSTARKFFYNNVTKVQEMAASDIITGINPHAWHKTTWTNTKTGEKVEKITFDVIHKKVISQDYKRDILEDFQQETRKDIYFPIITAFTHWLVEKLKTDGKTTKQQERYLKIWEAMQKQPTIKGIAYITKVDETTVARYRKDIKTYFEKWEKEERTTDQKKKDIKEWREKEQNDFWLYAVERAEKESKDYITPCRNREMYTTDDNDIKIPVVGLFKESAKPFDERGQKTRSAINYTNAELLYNKELKLERI